MAVSVENAFALPSEGAVWFVGSYVAVRILGLSVYFGVVADSEQRASVVSFSWFSVLGLITARAGAFFDPGLRDWIWAGAVVLDLGAAWIVGNNRSWGIHPGHFAERHGLIIIIALGESLIVAGSALTTDSPNSTMVAGGLAVFLTCLLWWTYFGWVREVMEERLIQEPQNSRAPLARDAYSFWHFPLVSRIIAMAVGFEAALHPDDYTLAQTALAVGLGLTLFLTSTAGALHRSVGCVLWNRLIVLAITLGGLALSISSSPQQILLVACAGLVAIVGIEQVTVRRDLGPH